MLLDVLLSATPASNWTVASSLAAIPPSINANSSISKNNKSYLVAALQSYNFEILLDEFSTLRIILSPTLNLYVDTPSLSSWLVSRITLWS